MRFSLGFLIVVLSLGQIAPVLTRSANNLRTGVYQEDKITPSNVAGLKLKYSIRIPNDARGVESQPLVLPQCKMMDGTTHDLLVLSTNANDVLGYDLHTGVRLWTAHLGMPIKSSNKIDFWNINDHWGVLSTGVIDPETHTWYGIAWISPDGTAEKASHSLHAVDLSTGRETHKGLSMNPLSYNAGNGSPTVWFASHMRKQRAALLLEAVGGRKVIVVCSGSVLETSQGASGWIAIADVDAWRFTASWSSTVKTYGAGIWMAGQGPSADDTGDFYVLTGNGGFDAKTEFSECFMRLRYMPPKDPKTQMGWVQVMDWWSPYSDAGRVGQNPTQTQIQKNFAPAVEGKVSGFNAADDSLGKPVNIGHGHEMMMNTAITPNAVPSSTKYAGWSDQDLGSGSIVVIPQDGIIGGAGKDGIWYAVKKSSMGKTQPGDFANPASNYAKLLTPPIWFTYAAFKHDAKGNVIGYEDAAPADVTKLDFAYDGKTHHMHSTPVVFSSALHGIVLYCWGENGNLRAWQVNSGGSLTFLANGAEVASPFTGAIGGMPGGMLALSSNGGTDGILWALVPMGDANRTITSAKLYAYDAQNFGKYLDGARSIKLLWQSNFPLVHPKFNVPIITGGYVVVPSFDGQVIVLGLN